MYEDRKKGAVCVCLRSRNRPVVFADEFPDVYRTDVASPFAAGVLHGVNPTSPTNQLTLVDMRNGKAAAKYVPASVRELAMAKDRGGCVHPLAGVR